VFSIPSIGQLTDCISGVGWNEVGGIILDHRSIDRDDYDEFDEAALAADEAIAAATNGGTAADDNEEFDGEEPDFINSLDFDDDPTDDEDSVEEVIRRLIVKVDYRGLANAAVDATVKAIANAPIPAHDVISAAGNAAYEELHHSLEEAYVVQYGTDGDNPFPLAGDLESICLSVVEDVVEPFMECFSLRVGEEISVEMAAGAHALARLWGKAKCTSLDPPLRAWE